jgi:hypothetical protein
MRLEGHENGREAGLVEALDRRLLGLELVEDEEAGPRRGRVLLRRRSPRRRVDLLHGRRRALGPGRLLQEEVREGRDEAGIGDEPTRLDDLGVLGDLHLVGGPERLDESVADDDDPLLDRRPGDRDDPAAAEGVGRADVGRGRDRGQSRRKGQDRDQGTRDGWGDARGVFHGPPLREVIYNKSKDGVKPTFCQF